MGTTLEHYLDEVRAGMAGALAETPLRDLIPDLKGIFGSGKMLRSRLAYRVGPAAGADLPGLVVACAAVEMVHAASLLHDDVIDGGFVRRNTPSFWVERGVAGAILLGDLLLFRALHLLIAPPPGAPPDLLQRLVDYTGEVCEAESEQELLLRGRPAGWRRCVSVARRKTGALFAFAAYACGGADARLAGALEQAGYAVGTAYQLADDILDESGDDREAGKTLGTDRARRKNTAATALEQEDIDAVAEVRSFCTSSLEPLAPWPAVQAAWKAYLDADMLPALERNLGGADAV